MLFSAKCSSRIRRNNPDPREGYIEHGSNDPLQEKWILYGTVYSYSIHGGFREKSKGFYCKLGNNGKYVAIFNHLIGPAVLNIAPAVVPFVQDIRFFKRTVHTNRRILNQFSRRVQRLSNAANRREFLIFYLHN